ncbi:MAG: hypothetical protein ABJA37_06095 [Ferruginibacter sp.]
MFKSLIKKVRWPIGYLIFFCVSCQNSNGTNALPKIVEDTIAKKVSISRAFSQITIVKKIIKSGDIITRTGNDFTSQSLKTLNRRDKTFSHCGIASIEHDTVFVYHALGGDWNPDQKIRRDIFEAFTEPYSNNEIGIFRFAVGDTIIKQIITVTKDFYKKEIMFDMDFNLKTDDRMYCAEFVYKTLVKASAGKLIFPLSHINHFEFIGVDDIFLHPLCHKQIVVRYK